MRRKFTSRIAHATAISAVQPTTASASGIWSNTDILLERRQNNWPLPVPPPVVIFNASTGPNNAVTGGWSLWNYDGGNVTVGTNATSAFVFSPWWTNGAVATVNNINLTGAVSITIDFEGTSDNDYGYASVSWARANGTREGFNLLNPSLRSRSRGLITIPITNGGVGRFTLDSANTRQYQYIYGLVVNYA